MTDEQFEEELKRRLKTNRVNIYRHKRYDRTHELLLRYCHAKNVDVAPLVWQAMAGFLKSQMK